jgi:hypothetical protein
MSPRALLSEWVVGVVFGPLLVIWGVQLHDWPEAGIGAALFVLSGVMWAFWRRDQHHDDPPKPVPAD